MCYVRQNHSERLDWSPYRVLHGFRHTTSGVWRRLLKRLYIQPMFGFLQGLAYGLFLSRLPWLLIGLIDPRLVLPTEPFTRLRVLIRYWLIVPFVALLIWVTSLWAASGEAWADGWPVWRPFQWRSRWSGPGAAGVWRWPSVSARPIRRRWRCRRGSRWSERRASGNRRAGSRASASGERRGDPRRSGRPRSAWWRRGRPDLAIQADRLYTRYGHVDAVLRGKFDRGS